MKITAVLLTLTAVVSADGVLANNSGPVQLDVVEATANTSATNFTAESGDQPEYFFTRYCYEPPNAAGRWYRIHKGDGPHTCHLAPLQSEWSMLKSYRDGGIQGVHWKFTDNENDPECMNGWNYHAADGRTLKTYVAGRTTTYGLNRRWCGLPVYHDGGVEGYQWQYCHCKLIRRGNPNN